MGLLAPFADASLFSLLESYYLFCFCMTPVPGVRLVADALELPVLKLKFYCISKEGKDMCSESWTVV
jgi:hypothetical protein